MKKTTTIVMSVVALSLVAVFGYAILGSDRGNTAEPSAVRVGREAAPFSLKLFSGEDFNLTDQRGKVTVINFWASWCPPCREEAPALERAWETYRDRVSFIGIAVWDQEQDSRKFLDEFGITYPVGMDASGEVAIEYGVTGLPETWFLDKDGRLTRRWLGALNDEQMKSFIEEAL